MQLRFMMLLCHDTLKRIMGRKRAQNFSLIMAFVSFSFSFDNTLNIFKMMEIKCIFLVFYVIMIKST